MRPLLDPDTPPIGRQPEMRVIAPSKRYPWYGSILAGDNYTVGQRQALARRGLDADALPTLTVKRQATDRVVWWPPSSLPPVFAFDCPVLGNASPGKVTVIAPDGETKVVHADGWGHFPFRKPRFFGE